MGVVIPFATRVRKNGYGDGTQSLHLYRNYRIVIKDGNCPETGNRIAIRIEMLNQTKCGEENEFLKDLQRRLQGALLKDCGVEFPERADDSPCILFFVFGEKLTRIIENMVPVLRQAGLTTQNTEVVSYFQGSVPIE